MDTWAWLLIIGGTVLVTAVVTALLTISVMGQALIRAITDGFSRR